VKSFTIFEAIPPGLQTTSKVLPFFIHSPEDQWGEILEGLPQIVQRLKEGVEQSSISAIVIGGSIGKHTFDEMSDIDVGVLTKDVVSTCLFVESAFGAAEILEDKKTSISYHYQAEKFGPRRFEIRVSDEKLLIAMSDKIIKKIPLNQIEQDFIANFILENLIFGNLDMTSLVKKLSYNEEQALYDIRQNVPLIRDYGFVKFLMRGDFTLYFYYLSVCKRALINLVYADNRVFHRGYKHESSLKENLAKFPSGVIESLNQCFFAPSVDSIQFFFEKFEEYRQSLYQGIGHAVTF
jgi:hypothetical protein